MFKACLQQVLVSYEQATMENDREDFLFALQGLLRLLAVMTYDAVLCQEFASADIERAAALRPDGAAAIQQPASTDMELLPLLCSILLEAPNSLCILLISCVLQNMSSCRGLFFFSFFTRREAGRLSVAPKPVVRTARRGHPERAPRHRERQLHALRAGAAAVHPAVAR